MTSERQKMKDMVEEMRERIKEKYGRVEFVTFYVLRIIVGEIEEELRVGDQCY